MPISWEGLNFGASDLQVCWDDFAWQVQALRMTCHHFCEAGAALYTGGLEKSQNELVRGRQLRTQLSMFEGSLAELLRFWCCQLQKLMTSRKIASCLTSSRSKIEEVSQNSFFFKLACRQIDRSIDRQLQLPLPPLLHYNYKYKSLRYISLR